MLKSIPVLEHHKKSFLRVLTLALILHTVLSVPSFSQSWKHVPTPVQIGLHSMTFFNPKGTGFACGDSVMLKTTDGGATWSVDTSIVPGEIRAVSPTTGFYHPYRTTPTMNLPLYRTTDSGTTWQPLPKTASFNKVTQWDAWGQFVAVGIHENFGWDAFKIYHSLDTGSNWHSYESPSINYGLTLIGSGYVYGGGSYQVESDPVIHSVSGLYPSSKQSYTVTGKKFLRSGAYFVPGTQRLFSMGFQGDKYGSPLLPSSYYGLYVSNDSGGRFKPICYSSLRNISFSPDGRHGAAVFNHTDSNRAWLLRTTDGGDTWGLQFINDSYQTIYGVLVVDSVNIFIFGTRGWIMRTTDGGGPILPFSTLGVNDKSSEHGTFLYPNPATTSVTLQGEAGMPIRYNITDVFGRSVMDDTFIGQRTVDISMLAAGNYMVCYTMGRERRMQKLTIMR